MIWNVEQGLAQAGRDLSRAEAARSELYRRVVAFLEHYEYLVCPSARCRRLRSRHTGARKSTELRGDLHRLDEVVLLISATGLPAISVPAGFTEDGLPVGLQILGRPRDEFSVLQLAAAFEQATQVWKRRPRID